MAVPFQSGVPPPPLRPARGRDSKGRGGRGLISSRYFCEVSWSGSNMQAGWLLQTADELPRGGDWLAPWERRRLAQLRVERRRREWLLGRWTAKLCLRRIGPPPARSMPLERIEIRATASGAPQAVVGGRPVAAGLSISHRAGAAVCVVLRGGAVGCDLELVEERSRAFLDDCFGAAERALVERAGAHSLLAVNAVWSAKESLLKLWRVGVNADPRSIRVSLEGVADEVPGWHGLSARSASGEIYRGWWRRLGGRVVAVVSVPPVGPPRRLASAAARRPGPRAGSAKEGWVSAS